MSRDEIYHRRLEEALDRMGRTHELADILEALESGYMQSFAAGDSWAVTQVVTFPRKRVLEVFLVVGQREDLPSLYDQVLAFAKTSGCALVRAFGRDGWAPDADKNGWQTGAQVYLKEIG